MALRVSALPGNGRAAHASVTEGAARAGLTARGAVYLLVGVLALQIAFGDGRRQAGRGGALAELAGKPFGAVLLWALGVGLVGMALWRLSEVVFGAPGGDGRSWRKRLAGRALCVLRGRRLLGALVRRGRAGRERRRSSDEQSRDATARALGLPGGQWLVAVAGAGVVVAGVWIGARAVMRSYHKHLRLGEMSRGTRRAVDTAGVVGGAARGLVFAVAGAFAIRAAVEYEPDEAKGLDDTIRSFAETPLGPTALTALTAVAAGLVLFGLFSFAMARWRRV